MNNKENLDNCNRSLDFIRENIYPLLDKIYKLDFDEYRSEIHHLGRAIRKQMFNAIGDITYYKDLYEEDINYDESNI